MFSQLVLGGASSSKKHKTGVASLFERVHLVMLPIVVSLIALGQANAQFTQQGTKLVANDAVVTPFQGYSVSLSSDGNTAIVGGPIDNSGAGAAWVFTRSGGVWTQQGSKLVGTGAVDPAYQGWSVSLSSDGNTAIVGGTYDNSIAGAAWVWTRSGGVWTQQGSKLVGTGAVGAAEQGRSVSLSSDGNTVIVGGIGDNSYAGAAWVWTRSGGVWTQQGSKLVGTGAVGAAAQGISVSLSSDGNTAIVGGRDDNSFAGAAWVWTRSGGVWAQQGSKLVGAGAVGGIIRQGASVSLSSDGNTAFVGGIGDNTGVGAAWVWTRSGGVWTQQGSKLVGTGAIGTSTQGGSVSLSSDGNTAIVTGYGDNTSAGATWVWTRSGGVWTQQGSKLVGTSAVNPANQGLSGFLSSDGNTAIVGGPGDNGGAGAAWIYTAPIPSTIALTSGNNQSGAISTGLVNPFVVTVTAGGSPAQGVSVTFAITSAPTGATGHSLSTTGATTNASGQVSSTLTLGNKVGTYTVTATSTGLSGSPIAFTATATAGAATTLSLISGNNQTGQVTTALANPFVVKVIDAGNNVVPGINVTFASSTSPTGATGQSLSTTSATTDINGQASTTLTFGTKSGTYTATATSGSLTGSPVVFTATATVGAATTLSLTSGNSQAGQINTALNPFVVTVTDVQSNPVVGVTITFSLSSAPLNQNGASLSVNSVATNASGQASSTLFLGSKIGSYGVTANAQGLSGSPVLFTATATTASPSQVVRIGGDNQSGQVNSTLPSRLIVQVTDAGGNPVSAITVSFSIFFAPQGATGQRVSPTSATTDFQGQVSTVLSLGNQAGQYRVSATSLGGAFVTFNANATVPSAVEVVELTPTEFALLQNYPNPFNPSTTIQFWLPRSGYVMLKVYDVFGSEVATLVAENLSAGRYATKWNATDVASGVYFYRLQAGSFIETKKIVLMK